MKRGVFEPISRTYDSAQQQKKKSRGSEKWLSDITYIARPYVCVYAVANNMHQ